MTKSSLAALLLSAACLTGPALAQTAGAPASSATTAAPSTGDAASTGGGQFITEQPMDQYRASKLVGIGVYGPDNQRVGDINEILMDKSGNAKAIVVGVGGFLGIGEKSVALPFSAVEWMNEPVPGSTAGGSGTAPGAPGANTAATAMSTGTAAGGTAASGTAASATAGGPTSPGPMTTGSTMTAMPVRSPAERAAANGYPDHAVIKMSKADLQNAPTFKYYSDTRPNSGASNATTSPMTTAPRQ